MFVEVWCVASRPKSGAILLMISQKRCSPSGPSES